MTDFGVWLFLTFTTIYAWFLVIHRRNSINELSSQGVEGLLRMILIVASLMALFALGRLFI